MSYFLNLFIATWGHVWQTLSANWIYLLASVVIAASLKVYLDPAQTAAFLNRYRNLGISAATAAAVTTPLCSCGTTAIILGMMAGMLPWGPIVAFMVSSPLTSPQELIYSAGLFGWKFALSFFAASIVLGLAGGAAASYLERRGLLANQARFVASCGCNTTITIQPPKSLRQVLNEMANTGPRLLAMFLGFAFIGYFLNSLLPAQWIAAIFGTGKAYSIPLAATLGLPFYVNTEASLPLVRALLDAGMNEGAALAFLITGAGTSFGAVAGALTIARWRVVGLVIAVLWVGAVLTGFCFNLLI